MDGSDVTSQFTFERERRRRLSGEVTKVVVVFFVFLFWRQQLQSTTHEGEIERGGTSSEAHKM